MVKKLRRKGDTSAAPAPKAAAPGSAKPGKFKNKAVKTYPEKLKAAAAAIAEASASAPVPAPQPIEASPAAAAANANSEPAECKREDKKMSWKEPMKGREEKGKDRKTSREETTKGTDEERVKREEKRRNEERVKREEKRRTMAKDDDNDDDERIGPGFIFMCSARTKPECYRNNVFGLPRGKMDVVEKIRPGAKLFLYDFDLKLMYGVYKADTKGGLDLVRRAFDGKFPAQVKFSVDIDCLPIPESSFKHAIKENYSSKGRFTQELSSKQVCRLLALFKPIGLSQLVPQHIEETHPPIVEDRREPYVYDERRPLKHFEERITPIDVLAPSLQDHYKITHSLRPPLPDEPHQMPTGLESHQAPIALGSHRAPHMRELQHVPPAYYHQMPPTSSYLQPHMGSIYERTAAETTARDYGVLPGELAARSERVDELYRSYKLSTRAMDPPPGLSYATTSYENPGAVYSESLYLQRPVSTRISGSSVPVSTRYSFSGPPTVYR